MVAKVFCNEFSKSIFWAGVEEFFLIKNKSFILLNNMFRKNEKKKKNNCQKNLIVCALLETEDHINSFKVNLPPPNHLKTSGC